MTYSWLVLLHGSLRWLVLIVAALAIFRAWRGSRRGLWSRSDETLGIVFISLLDTQLLVGIALYAISPIRIAAYAAPGSSLDNEMGFFAFVHPFVMVAAVIVAHVGKALAKRAIPPAQKQNYLLRYYLIAVAIILLVIPWWRPFLRF